MFSTTNTFAPMQLLCTGLWTCLHLYHIKRKSFRIKSLKRDCFSVRKHRRRRFFRSLPPTLLFLSSVNPHCRALPSFSSSYSPRLFFVLFSNICWPIFIKKHTCSPPSHEKICGSCAGLWSSVSSHSSKPPVYECVAAKCSSRGMKVLQKTTISWCGSS